MGDNPHLLLGRIRFLNRCIETFRRSEPVPECLCYVPKEVCYKICKDSSSSSSASSSGASVGGSTVGKTIVSVFESPHQTAHSKKACKYNIEPKKGTCIRTTGEEYCNSQGLWVKINKVRRLDAVTSAKAFVLLETTIILCLHTLYILLQWWTLTLNKFQIMRSMNPVSQTVSDSG